MSAALDHPTATRTGRKQKPYLARKASAQEIRETVGVTKADRKLVDAVFAKLGLHQGQNRSAASKPSKSR